MNINDIRKTFLDYFEGKSHKIVASAPMVVKNDPTLMFTNAGMNQFKDYFLGYNEAKDKRVANTQKCLRVSGKHNDLEEVGVDTYHHTMFEMLGNWSFGDYFKEEAISWAWELLTDVYKLNKDQLYITVFEGDENDGVPVDQESIDIWKKFIDEDRIILCDKKDNFWEMGDSGPCGPCSEIHIDIRDEAERAKGDGKSFVNADHPQVIEIWNLVFMQYNRKANGSLENLPAKHVDTGMGLERLAMVMQGKQSNYDTDLFQHLIKHLEKVSGFEYGKTEEIDIALRVIADHIRAIAFSIADGQLPSNNGAGYVIRRILRRAVRYGYQTLELKDPFLTGLVVPLVEVMGDAFPELKKQSELIQSVIKEEETSFFRTLETGLVKLGDLMKGGSKELNGADVFELFDTYGFPLDLTALIARENGFTVDLEGYNVELAKQKERSRAATSMESEDWVVIKDDDVEEFIGYDMLDADIWITKYRKVKQKNKEFYQLVFNITPFYAEGGGQVGDKGWIESDSEKLQIWDTKKENNLIVHYANEIPKNITAHFKAHVDKPRRKAIQANHTATHLLHHALREILGTHVEQKGSLVADEYLRFDFSHFAKVEEEQLKEIETHVNKAIAANVALNERRSVPMAVAEELGAMALFGEKYGDLVRVIQFGSSVELCGGCHVQTTGDINVFKIISEGSVAAGVRRIEAITADKAQSYFMERADKFEEINALLKKPKDIVASVEELLEKNNQLNKEIEQLKKGQVKQLKSELLEKIEDKGGMNYLSAILDLDGGSIKDLCFQMKGEVDNFFAVIGGKADGKATLSIVISEDLAKSKDLHAGNMVREAAKHIQGGGGGQPFFATAGGKNPAGLSQAIDAVEKVVLG
ncbi:alanine--tRNA ligase [Paracrocinitomix mangrovi]|uniref:alanine--tRNA ligase n=1 Tax=Paracrocinitomix mangrovi TaxID=2862509 RepID=UPI001C8EFEC5|nr:alanine--tRNA ligase [Paracrocinitomix mangrovi]UKN01877.1 alanine--tRNA ligase [Paracrocinitomix mangrovi]